MKRFHLTLCLLAIAITQCFAGGPAADIHVDALNIADGAVSAIKTDGSIALTANVYNKSEIDEAFAAVSLPLDTISGNTGAASTTIELTDGVKLHHGIMFIGGATYDLSNPNHVTLDNTGDNTVITFDAVGFDTSYVILRLRSAALPVDTISGNIGAASTTIELTDGIKLDHGIMFIGGATYDLSNPNHVTLDNTGSNTVITFDAVGFDTSYVILRLR